MTVIRSVRVLDGKLMEVFMRGSTLTMSGMASEGGSYLMAITILDSGKKA